MRKDVAFTRERLQVIERRACKLMGMDRVSYRYKPRPNRNAELREAIVLARQKPRYEAAYLVRPARPSDRSDAHLPDVSSRRAGSATAQAQAAFARRGRIRI
jgi:hypothetical protein